MPVGQFEGVVAGEVFRHGFLHGGGTFEVVGFCGPRVRLFIYKVCHPLGCCFHQFCVLMPCGLCGLVAVDFFCHIYIMWLLPNEERACVGGGFACPRVGHLHPADAFVALPLGDLSGYGGSCLPVPVEHGGKHFGATPKGEVYGVPPRHFQMWTTEPGVVGQSCFLWRHVVRTVYLCEVLRKHDAAFQFLGAWVGAA